MQVRDLPGEWARLKPLNPGSGEYFLVHGGPELPPATPFRVEAKLDTAYLQNLQAGVDQICMRLFVQSPHDGTWTVDSASLFASRETCQLIDSAITEYTWSSSLLTEDELSSRSYLASVLDPNPSDAYLDRDEMIGVWVEEASGNTLIGDVHQFRVRDSYIEQLTLQGLDENDQPNTRTVLHLPDASGSPSMHDGSAVDLVIDLTDTATAANNPLEAYVVLGGMLEEKTTQSRAFTLQIPAGATQAVAELVVSGSGQMPDDPNLLGCFSWLAWARVQVFEQGGIQWANRRKHIEIPVAFRPNGAGAYSLDGDPCVGVERPVGSGGMSYHTRPFDVSLDLSVFAGPELIDVLVDEDGGVIGGAVPPVVQ